jgi:hypothetical protein
MNGAQQAVRAPCTNTSGLAARSATPRTPPVIAPLHIGEQLLATRGSRVRQPLLSLPASRAVQARARRCQRQANSLAQRAHRSSAEMAYTACAIWCRACNLHARIALEDSRDDRIDPLFEGACRNRPRAAGSKSAGRRLLWRYSQRAGAVSLLREYS